MGILLCRDRKTLTSIDGYAQFNEQFDRKHWQHIVHNDASEFLTLCEELDVVPDLWSLHEWSAWRTPSTFQKRFETVFFLAALASRPQVLMESNEVKDYEVCIRLELTSQEKYRSGISNKTFSTEKLGCAFLSFTKSQLESQLLFMWACIFCIQALPTSPDILVVRLILVFICGLFIIIYS